MRSEGLEFITCAEEVEALCKKLPFTSLGSPAVDVEGLMIAELSLGLGGGSKSSSMSSSSLKSMLWLERDDRLSSSALRSSERGIFRRWSEFKDFGDDED